MAKKGRKTHRKPWKPQEIRYLRKNFGKTSVEELSKELDRDIASIRVAVYALCLTNTKH